LEFMQQQFPDENAIDLKNHLKKTSIPDDIMNWRMVRLSFSQRSCVIFAKLTYVPPHLLIMDEPTNFLDLESVDSLISAVNKFKGGLIVVTHNRDFLKRTAKHFLSIVPGQFLEFNTMKEAERATYSFISALEEGRAVDFKKAIQENRGGGALLSEDDRAANQARLTKQQQIAKEKEEAKRAEEERVAKIAADKEARRLAKVALQKTDWVAGDKCWAPIKGNKYEAGTVVRNVPAMGVTVELVTGKTVMVEAKKLRQENPAEDPNAAPAEAAPARGGKGGNARGGARGGAAAGGRGGAQGAARGGRGGAARGGAQGAARGGARGGRGKK
jgi:energy-coupling factor transporter ATP-binding protein EcfA2